MICYDLIKYIVKASGSTLCRSDNILHGGVIKHCVRPIRSTMLDTVKVLSRSGVTQMLKGKERAYLCRVYIHAIAGIHHHLPLKTILKVPKFQLIRSKRSKYRFLLNRAKP